jgi:hypothetical protein
MGADIPPQSEASNAGEVRAQLNRLLEHRVFKSSHRCAQLLEYLVEYRLRGETAAPKERERGVKIFEREPDYDTADDPVVRGAANETRNRIAQYYLEPGHESEPRIDLPSGSYLLEFRIPEEATKPEDLQSQPTARRGVSRSYLALAAIVLILCVIGAIWLRTPSALDRFWSPILDSPGRMLVCVLRTSPSVPIMMRHLPHVNLM